MEKSRQSNNLGAGLVLLSALMFGSYGVWSRLIGPAMGNFFQGWTGALIILILLLPILLIRKELVRIERRDIKWLIVFLVFTSLTRAPLFYAFNHMDIGAASLLFFVSTFLTMNIVGIAFLGERFSKVKAGASLLAVVGMYFVFSFSISQFAIFAALMAVVNGIASGGEIAFSKKLTGNYSPLYVVTLSWGIILVTNLLISLLIGETQTHLSFSMPWFWQLCYSLASLCGFWLVIAGFKHIDAGVGALIGLLEIIFSIVFGVWVFNEHLTLSVICGGILIIIAASLPNLPGFQRESQFVK